MAADGDELELSPVEQVFQESFELIDALSGTLSEDESRKLMRKYVEDSARKKNPKCPDFEAGLKWFNVSSPLSINTSLQGKVVVLDFFTYCCINCMHILPDLHALEQQFSIEDGVVVVGVHSAKFENEKLSANILSAVLRYDITHPVVNDRNIALWSELMIQCWPTLLVLGPHGEILFMLMGEAHTKLLAPFVAETLAFYKETGDIESHSLPVVLSKNSLPPSPLLFPGKIALDAFGRRIAVADTGHHRVLITDTAGVVQHCIGSGESGWLDGDFKTARFNAPQGVTWNGDIIYVADTENHVIRQIDLASRQVTTLAGTGKQGEDKEGGKQGLEQPISSPWDVLIGPSPDGQCDSVLYIAMAGTHQIWLFFLKDATWVKGRQFTKGTCIRFAGSGNEEIRNNTYPHNAAFAQPSGLALGHIGPKAQQCLLVADSESSSIRSVNLPEGAAKGVVGATRDPKNLFAFGDVDGKSYDAKLQHPLAVAVRTTTNTLFVADSYNHKIKEVNLESYECRTLLGTGKTGNDVGTSLDTVAFNEPGGLAVDPAGEKLYIADTNNHSIKVFHFKTQALDEVKVIFDEDTENGDVVSDEEDTLDSVAIPGSCDEHDTLDSVRPIVSTKPEVKKSTARSIPRRATVIVLNALRCRQGSTIELHCDLDLGEGFHLTEGATSQWSIWVDSGIGDGMHQDLLDSSASQKGMLLDLSSQPHVELTLPNNKTSQPIFLMFECTMYYCDDGGACRMKTLVFRQVLLVSEEAHLDKYIIPLKYTLQ